MVYAVTAKLLTKVGESHLAWLAADRATHAAMAADSVPAQGLAAYQVVCALLEDEQLDQAERTAISSAERLTGQPPQMRRTSHRLRGHFGSSQASLPHVNPTGQQPLIG